MTALELLDLLESTPEGPRSDKEMDRLSGIATPGDVDQRSPDNSCSDGY